MGPDVVEECLAVADLPPTDPDQWTPILDPHDFNQTHGPLKIEDY